MPSSRPVLALDQVARAGRRSSGCRPGRWPGGGRSRTSRAGRRRSSPPSVSASTPVPGRRPEQRQVGLGQRDLGRGGAEVRAEDVGVAGVEDGRLDRRADQRLRVGDQVGVERVVAGDEHRERVGARRARPGRPAATSRPGCPGSRPAAPRRGRRCRCRARARWSPPSRRAALAQRCLERPPVLGQVAAAVGRHRSATARAPPRRAAARRSARPTRRPCGSGRTRACGPRRTTRSASRSATSAVAARRTGAPFSPPYDVNGGSQRPSDTWPLRRGVVGDRLDRQPGEPRRRDLGLGHGRRGQHERRARRRTTRRPGAAGAAPARRGRRRPRGSGGTRRRRRSCSCEKNRAQRACPGSSEWCSMSGLVRTYSALSRAQSRCSRGLSPSCVQAASPGTSSEDTARSWSWASALVGER